MSYIQVKSTKTVRHIRCGICGQLLRVEMDNEDKQYEVDIAREFGWNFNKGLQIYECKECK